ncbi:MAG: rhomboid family intramembrane serine protease [Pseudomonadota bacterium]
MTYRFTEDVRTTFAPPRDGALLLFAVIACGYIVSFVIPVSQLFGIPTTSAPIVSYLTYAWFHTEYWHAGFNLLGLWLIGRFVGEVLAGWAMWLCYVVSAALTALTIDILCPERSLMIVGASGGLCGLLGWWLGVRLQHVVLPLIVAGVLWGLDFQIDRQPTMNLWTSVLYHAVPMVSMWFLGAGFTSFSSGDESQVMSDDDTTDF